MAHAERFVKLVEDAKSRIVEITPEDVRARLDAGADLVVIDTREESEWNAGHVAGAVHLGKGIIERDIEALVPDPDKAIVLYCGGGFRSALAADNLQRMGYTNVLSMAEGWRGWTSREYPVEG